MKVSKTDGIPPQKLKTPVSSGKTGGETRPAEALSSLPRRELKVSDFPGTASFLQPKNNLESSVLKYSRFFSLPLNRTFLRTLRVMILQAETEKEPLPGKSPAEAARKEAALVSGAAAAADKGLLLSGEALRRYAAAIEAGAPDKTRHERQDSQQEGRGGHEGGTFSGNSENSENSSNSHNSGGSGSPGEWKGQKKREFSLEEASKPGELKARLGFLPGESPAGLLNRIKGRYSGKHWIVLPFSVEEFQVSLRILLNEEPRGNEADYFTLDIAERGRRRIFLCERKGESFSLKVYVQPPERTAALRSLGTKLSRLLDLEKNQVTVLNDEENSVFMKELEEKNRALPSINEEV
ncbi:MAG: hypothetical protein LBK83_08190 [Treponema sp.]|nr:hypothetical protein [Treponema sp.]